MTIPAVVFIATMATVVGVSGPAAAQVAYQAANAPTSIVPRRQGLIHFDIAEASVGLTFVRESNCGTDCQPSGLGVAGFLSAAARKGQSSVFSQVEFVPGWKAGTRLTFAFGGSEGAYNVLFLGSTFSTTQRRTVELNADTTQGVLDEVSQHDIEFLIGYNHSFKGGSIVAIGASHKRELSTPGIANPQEICVPGTQVGSAVVFPLCSNRYIGPLGDRWVTQLRSDIILPFLSLGDGALKPRLAIIAAASVDMITEGDPVNFGFGPAIIPAVYGGHVITSLLLEFYDSFDANGIAPGLGDRIVVRLGVSVPLEVFVGR